MQLQKNSEEFDPHAGHFNTLRGKVSHILSFFTVGLFSTITYFVLANTLIYLTPLHPSYASLFAYVFAIYVSYNGQSRFTFSRTSSDVKEKMRFLTMSLSGAILSFCIIDFTSNKLQVPAFWGTVSICILIPAFSYLTMRFWVFELDTGCNTRNAHLKVSSKHNIKD